MRMAPGESRRIASATRAESGEYDIQHALEYEVGAPQRALHDVDEWDAGNVVQAHAREAHLEQVGHDLKGHVLAHAVVTNGQDVVVRGGREGNHHLVDLVARDGLGHISHRSEVAEAA